MGGEAVGSRDAGVDPPTGVSGRKSDTRSDHRPLHVLSRSLSGAQRCGLVAAAPSVKLLNERAEGTATLIDDIDASAAGETVEFALDGASYEIDLNAKNTQKLRSALTKFTAEGRHVTNRSSAPPGESRPAGTAPKTKSPPGTGPQQWLSRLRPGSGCPRGYGRL